MKVGSLFSGGGLGDFGFLAAGMEISWQCEIDPYCQKILALRYPESKKFTDIKSLKGDQLERVDIITGGFPCQPFSVAGKRKGKDDNRYLWPEMLRVIKECRPRWVVGENVPGIINLALDTVCLDLEAEGYEVWPIVFPSHALGAWHKRDRIWIICHSKHNGQPSSKDTGSIDEGVYGGEAWPFQASEFEGSSEQYAPLANSGLFGSKKHEKQAMGTKQLCEDVANTASQRCESRPDNGGTHGEEAGRSESNIMRPKKSWASWWKSEPAVGRVADGIANRVYRLKCLGNGQTPACTYTIGRMILEIENAKH